MNSFTRNGQTVTFTTDEYGALVQTSPFRSSTDGKPIPLLDYEIDGTRIIASNAGIARQAYQQWKTDTDPEDTLNTLPVEHICSPDTCNTDVTRWAVPLHVAQKSGYSGPRYSIQSRLACTAEAARYRVLSGITKAVGKPGMRDIEVGEAIPRDREKPLFELSTPAFPLPLSQHRAASKIEGKAKAPRKGSFKRDGKGFKPGDAVSFQGDVFVLLDRAPLGKYGNKLPARVEPACERAWWDENVPHRYLHTGGTSGAAWWLQRIDGTLVELPVREKALERLAFRCTADNCRQRSLERFGGPCPDHADPAQGTALTTLF